MRCEERIEYNSRRGICNLALHLPSRPFLHDVLEQRDRAARFASCFAYLGDGSRELVVGGMGEVQPEDVDAGSHQLTVACAGHKVPLLRFSASDKQLRLVQPEGIALAFDKGPVFDKRLQTQSQSGS